MQIVYCHSSSEPVVVCSEALSSCVARMIPTFRVLCALAAAVAQDTTPEPELEAASAQRGRNAFAWGRKLAGRGYMRM